MSVKEVVESHIRTARICRERYSTMSEVDWLAGGIIFTLKHSMSVLRDQERFTQKAYEHIQELRNSDKHQAAATVSDWMNAIGSRAAV
jgi:hypothetical protein